MYNEYNTEVMNDFATFFAVQNLNERELHQFLTKVSMGYEPTYILVELADPLSSRNMLAEEKGENKAEEYQKKITKEIPEYITEHIYANEVNMELIGWEYAEIGVLDQNTATEQAIENPNEFTIGLSNGIDKYVEGVELELDEVEMEY